jgi:hydroxymethylbilane synthase
VTRIIRIASRGSELALWQTHFVRDELLAANPERRVEITVVKTTGDRILDVPLARIGDKGLFTKELDEILLAEGADLAVHSLKDVPTRLPPGLSVVTITRRADPRDVVLFAPGREPALSALPSGARVGTSSLRRRAQLLAVRPDLDVQDLRGNLNTRLARLDSGDYDAILLAAAGVLRLGWAERIGEYLDPPAWLPAVGQGALAIVARTDDGVTRAALEGLHHEATAACVRAERSLLRTLEGGCQIPIGALAWWEDGEVRMDAVVAAVDGTQLVRDSDQSPASDVEGMGERLALRMLGSGAAGILESLRGVESAPPPPAP